MTCRGYDPKAVSVPKSVKRLAATCVDRELRNSIIRSAVKQLETELRSSKSGKDSK